MVLVVCVMEVGSVFMCCELLFICYSVVVLYYDMMFVNDCVCIEFGYVLFIDMVEGICCMVYWLCEYGNVVCF